MRSRVDALVIETVARPRQGYARDLLERQSCGLFGCGAVRQSSGGEPEASDRADHVAEGFVHGAARMSSGDFGRFAASTHRLVCLRAAVTQEVWLVGNRGFVSGARPIWCVVSSYAGGVDV